MEHLASVASIGGCGGPTATASCCTPCVAVRPFPVQWHPRVETEDADDLWGTKVGGIPRAIQSGDEIDWSLEGEGRVGDAVYVLQAETADKSGVHFGDMGSAHVGFSPTRGWLLTIEFT